MSKLAIVVVGYNRLNSVKRLINSLEQAIYPENVDLIFDLDKANINDVVDYADKYKWLYGEKYVRTYPTRQGLRSHMMAIASWFEKYDALIILEDDIVVAPGFYLYTKENVTRYENVYDVIGISLYSHVGFCEEKAKAPIKKEYDNYFVQSPCSWGQVWLKTQWLKLVGWYYENENKGKTLFDNIDMPQSWLNFGEKSYLKFAMRYMVEFNKFFSEPYDSFTTCFSDVGEHCVSEDASSFQVPLFQGIRDNYHLSPFNFNAIRYDAFDESINLINYFEGKNIQIDLYGDRKVPNNKDYFLSTQMLNFKIEKTYGLKMRPHELNIYNDVPGEEIFLYDLRVSQKNTYSSNNYKKAIYNYGPRMENGKFLFWVLGWWIKKKISRQ